jgi:pSer/pThr/pTyr-binding forkhead associated (FHA) protein
MPRLDFYLDCELILKIKLRQQAILIGRGVDCDLQLAADRVSRHHTQIAPAEAGAYEITDLSANGTRLNSEMLTKSVRLGPGDRIYIEKYVIIFQPDEAPAETLEKEETTRI